MLTNDQTQTYTVEALAFIAANPLTGQQALRAHLAAVIGTENDWRYATDILLQDVVLLAQHKAFAAADQAAKDEVEANVLSAWQARMAVPVEAAPVLPTTVTPVAPKTHGDHIEAIKSAYYGTDPDAPTFDLYAACRYGLLHDITPDDVANAIARPVGDCRALMFPGV